LWSAIATVKLVAAVARRLLRDVSRAIANLSDDPSGVKKTPRLTQL